MEPTPFDELVRALTASAGRRRLLGLALTAPLAPLLAGVSETEASRKKQQRKRKKRKNRKRVPDIVLNSFNCVDVGQQCYGRNDLCCSGICDGDAATSVCIAHNTLTCTGTSGTCQELPAGECAGGNGSCFTTTGNAPFCGTLGFCDCAPCRKDIDCVAEHGAGAACIQCAGTADGQCTGVNGSSGTACVPAAVA